EAGESGPGPRSLVRARQRRGPRWPADRAGLPGSSQGGIDRHGGSGTARASRDRDDHHRARDAALDRAGRRRAAPLATGGEVLDTGAAGGAGGGACGEGWCASTRASRSSCSSSRTIAHEPDRSGARGSAKASRWSRRACLSSSARRPSVECSFDTISKRDRPELRSTCSSACPWHFERRKDWSSARGTSRRTSPARPRTTASTSESPSSSRSNAGQPIVASSMLFTPRSLGCTIFASTIGHVPREGERDRQGHSSHEAPKLTEPPLSDAGPTPLSSRQPVVNVATRLEKMNKCLGSFLVVSDDLFWLAPAGARLGLVGPTPVEVRGHGSGVRFHHLPVCRKADGAGRPTRCFTTTSWFDATLGRVHPL